MTQARRGTAPVYGCFLAANPGAVEGTDQMPPSRTSPTYYRVFQHRGEPGLCCAVRGTMLIPHFVRVGSWDFGANFREDDSLPFGFEPARAREASAAFGYYLFHHPCETLAPKHCRHWA